VTLEQIIADKKRAGMSAIEIQQYLRNNNMIVSFIEVKKIYLGVK